jgi:hypothetical protein
MIRRVGRPMQRKGDQGFEAVSASRRSRIRAQRLAARLAEFRGETGWSPTQSVPGVLIGAAKQQQTQLVLQTEEIENATVK